VSRTTLYGFHSDGMRKVDEFHNAWGFAVRVWDPLCKRYCPELGLAKSGGVYAKWERLWSEPELPFLPFERIALQSTYDRAVVRAADVETLSGIYNAFDVEHPIPGSANHLRAIADAMQDWVGEYADAIGFCFHVTSVSENVWQVKGCGRSCCDGSCESRDYDLNRDADHFFVEM
jgi:hypothetical protein